MKRILAVILTMVMVIGTIGYASPVEKKEHYFSKNPTPPNEAGIVRLLIEQGILDKNSTPEQIDEAVQNYVRQKFDVETTRSFAEQTADVKTMDKKLLLEKVKENASNKVNIDNLIRGSKNGVDISSLNAINERNMADGEKRQDKKVREGKLLILLAEFADDEYGQGPIHNQIDRPDAENNTDLWVEDFSKEHYNKMLFTPGGYDAVDKNGEKLHLDSMIDYYMEQSGGSYKVGGNAYGWFKLPHSEAYYGDDDASGHDNKLPGTAHDLVADLLKVAHGSVPFEDYDVEDPNDLDKDGNYDEADGIIDHLVIVHSGIDQSGGGGAQGDNAIWAHSSNVFEYIPSDHPTTDYWNGNMVARNYIIQGENGAIGVFCHEFGHDLGLPDEYDTNYTGNGDAVGFYSLMSSGSWIGNPLGSKPAPMSPWGRMVLGKIWGGKWVQPTEVNVDSIKRKGKHFTLDETTTVGKNKQVIKVNLPQKQKDTVAPNQGSYEFFGGKSDDIDNKMAAQVALPAAANISLEFSAWYNIEDKWDFGFVQVSEDNGATWKSLSNDNTVNEADAQAKKEITDNLPGFTGSSSGWTVQSFDLTPYAGKTILLSFRYMTDAATTLDGFYIDEIKITAGDTEVLQDDAENGESKWAMQGWTLSQGYEMKDHFYMFEWRSHNNTDASLKYCYNYVDSIKGIAEYYRYEPGLLIWYRDEAYDDNWVGVHPGNGFLSVVDAHAKPILVDGKAARTRIQIHDAAFNLDFVPSKKLTILGKSTQIGNSFPTPIFDDSKAYWYESAPHAGVKIPKYGLKASVLMDYCDYSKGEIILFK